MTKYIICLGDGMADEPLVELNNQTPLQFANIPNMNKMASEGECGLVHTVPNGLSPGSDVANMGILGYNPQKYYTGRGPIEAASMGISVPEGLIIFRCNFVCIENNIMKDFTAGHISNEEGAGLFKELEAHFENSTHQFFPGVGYRNIILLQEKFKDLICNAPHDITDKEIGNYVPKGPLELEMKQFMDQCHQILMNSKINQKRLKNGLSPATHIWPWSQGKLPLLPSFVSTQGKTGGIVTAVDLLKGLGKLSGLKTPNVEGATGFLDTNYQNKLAESFKILETEDFVYIHIEAPDEAGHMGDAKLKTKAIEDFDREIVGPCLNYAKENPDTVVMVLPDHPTPCAKKTHTNAPVPFAIYTSNQESASTALSYNESDAMSTGVVYKTPWDLLSYFLSL